MADENGKILLCPIDLKEDNHKVLTTAASLTKRISSSVSGGLYHSKICKIYST